uniref:Uncharacterized protein n=1 Tax=Trypanosoma vivax (strain Y486) TaxID=1055687 RepID=G0U0C4_TRYVY|nr:hypothetical protein TVY486_0801300 [Trypanosoma vivax Y486]
MYLVLYRPLLGIASHFMRLFCTCFVPQKISSPQCAAYIDLSDAALCQVVKVRHTTAPVSYNLHFSINFSLSIICYCCYHHCCCFCFQLSFLLKEKYDICAFANRKR